MTQNPNDTATGRLTVLYDLRSGLTRLTTPHYETIEFNLELPEERLRFARAIRIHSELAAGFYPGREPKTVYGARTGRITHVDGIAHLGDVERAVKRYDEAGARTLSLAEIED